MQPGCKPQPNFRRERHSRVGPGQREPCSETWASGSRPGRDAVVPRGHRGAPQRPGRPPPHGRLVTLSERQEGRTEGRADDGHARRKEGEGTLRAVGVGINLRTEGVAVPALQAARRRVTWLPRPTHACPTRRIHRGGCPDALAAVWVATWHSLAGVSHSKGPGGRPLPQGPGRPSLLCGW